ncbi:hypothetical protein HDU99_000235, partial [Rhizoclosmatium hyalinum]
MNLKPIQILVLAALVVLVNAVAIPQPESVKEAPVQRDDARDNQNGGVMIKSMEQLKEVLAGRTFTLPNGLGKVNETIHIELKPAASKNQTGLLNMATINNNNNFATGPENRCLFRGQNLWDGQWMLASNDIKGWGDTYFIRVRSDYLAMTKMIYDVNDRVHSWDIWTVGKGSGTSDSHLSYQNDGNLCYYHENSPNPGWCSNTYGRGDMNMMCIDANDGRLLMGYLFVTPFGSG